MTTAQEPQKNSELRSKNEELREVGASSPRTSFGRTINNIVAPFKNSSSKGGLTRNEGNLSFLPLGGVGEVTKNLFMYTYNNEILLVDCGLGFADETMLGIDLMIPDIRYLLDQLKMGKKIVGMVITHGHEDHMGALPFILPQLPQFPIYATSFTATMANAKLQEFELKPLIKPVGFNTEVRLGSFACTFIHVTHSIPDTAHIFIKTPVGNFYHGSDYKFDLTPSDGAKTDFQGIAKVGSQGIRCLMSECLGSERTGYTSTDASLAKSFEEEMRKCTGKFIVTTYSSNIARLNQIISIAEKLNKYVCFVGRSLLKTKDLARQKGLLTLKKEREIQVDQLKRYNDKDVVLFVAGSQGQENSALSRMVNGEHRDVTIKRNDVIIFSSDPIPGNEISINAIIDELSRLGIRVIYSDISRDFHVSGHGSSQELLMLMSLLRPKQVLPISGTYKHMVGYKRLAQKFGFADQDIFVLESGQEILFSRDKTMLGQKIPIKNVYVDEVSGEEVEQYVLHDRQKISQEGIVAIIAEVDSENSTVIGRPQVVARGFGQKEIHDIEEVVIQSLKKAFPPQKRVTDWIHVRKRLKDSVERAITSQLKRRPLVLPVVIEV